MLLTDKDREYLDACDQGGFCYTGRMLAYLDKWTYEGIASGRFTKQEAESDLEVALYRAFALLQNDLYLSYAQVVDILHKARANASHSGVWHYRMAVGLTHIGRLEEALLVAEKGCVAEPDYPWGWLHLGRLRAHFGDKEGALKAAEKGLDLVPDDPEFLQLQKEIKADVLLPVMLCHYIDPKSDANLQNLHMNLKEVLDKQLALTCIIKDPVGFEAVKKAFGIEELKEDIDVPFCLCANIKFNLGPLHVVFRMNEAGFSHLSPTWVKHCKSAIEELLQQGNFKFEEITKVFLDLDRTIHFELTPKEGDESRVIHFKVTGGPSNENASLNYAKKSSLSLDERAIFDRVTSLNKEDGYDESIQILENISDAERHPLLTLELARALNNASSSKAKEFQRSVELLKLVKEYFENKFEWQFHMGYALFSLNRYDEALPYLERAEALRKGHIDTLEMMRTCRRNMCYPIFAQPFYQKVSSFWQLFEQKADNWQKRLANTDEFTKVIDEIKQLVENVLPETSVALAVKEAYVEVNLSSDGNCLRLYLLRAMVRAMPKELKDSWKLTLCRPAMPSCAELVLKMGLREYAAKDLIIFENFDDDGDLCLTIYTKHFETLQEEEVQDAFYAVNLLLDHALGEVAHMKHFYKIKISKTPESGVGFSLPEYVRYLHKKTPQKFEDTVDDYLDDPIEINLNLKTDGDCDYLLDVKHGLASYIGLISSYFRNEPEEVRYLHQLGVTAGMIFVDSQDHNENSRAKILEELRDLLRDKANQVYESFGQIYGHNYAYDLFFAWDLPEVIDLVNEFAESNDKAFEIGFHSFFREAAALIIKQPEDE